MTALDNTIEKIARILRRHLSAIQRGAIIRELKEIPGNKSFRETIQLLEIELKAYDDVY